MCQAHFARPRHAGAAADQPRVGNAVVRRSERPLVQQAAGTAQQTRDAVNLRGFNGLFEGERRQHARQTLGEHGLTRARWADHEDVVRAGRCHFQGALCHGLAADVAEIRPERGAGRRRFAVGAHREEFFRPGEHGHHFGQIVHAVDVDALHHRGLGRIFRGHNQVANSPIARADRYRERAAYRPHGSIERQLAHHDMAVQPFDRAHRAQNAQRHRQIESGSLLAHIGWRQVDRELLIGIAEAGIEKRALDPLAAFAHGGIGHANHHGIARVARREHVDFDIDQMSIDAIDGSAARFKQRH